MLGRARLRLLTRTWHPDAIVVTNPVMYEHLPRSLSGTPCFYDCMDLAVGFARDEEGRRLAARQENRLLQHAAGVFVSSSFLEAKIRATLRPGVGLTLVRNGIDETFDAIPARALGPGRAVRLGYFGTIAHWFDWGLIGAALRADPQLEMHLWGPVADPAPELGRVFLHGPVPREGLPKAVQDMDALVLPFVVDDLIRGVDPVKLYEYVALGLPALAVYYPELEQFRGLVNFYSDEASFLALLGTLRAKPDTLRPDPVRARELLSASTWHARARSMADSIVATVLKEEAS